MKRNYKSKQEARVKTLHPKSRLLSPSQIDLSGGPVGPCKPQGVAAVLVFMALCSIGLWTVPLQSAVSAEMASLLGSTPPVTLINIALAVYFSCALIQVLPRAFDTNYRYKGWSHIAYLATFYIFYFFSGSLESNLVVIFVTGMILLVFEAIAIKLHHRRQCLESAD